MKLTPSPHWRNCWIFLAGQLFVDPSDHKRDLVVDVVESVDSEAEWPSWLYPVGPGLAAHLLDDGLADTTPRWADRLIEVSLRALTGPFPPDLKDVAVGLTASLTPNRKLRVRNALKTAYASTPRAQSAAWVMERYGDFGAPVPGAIAIDRDNDSSYEEVSVASFIRELVSLVDLNDSQSEIFESTISELDTLYVKQSSDGDIVAWCTDSSKGLYMTYYALLDPSISSSLSLLFGTLSPSEWKVELALARFAGPRLARRPIGNLME